MKALLQRIAELVVNGKINEEKAKQLLLGEGTLFVIIAGQKFEVAGSGVMRNQEGGILTLDPAKVDGIEIEVAPLLVAKKVEPEELVALRKEIVNQQGIVWANKDGRKIRVIALDVKDGALEKIQVVNYEGDTVTSQREVALAK